MSCLHYGSVLQRFRTVKIDKKTFKLQIVSAPTGNLSPEEPSSLP